MTNGDALREGVKALRYLGIEGAELDAEVLLCAATGLTKERLLGHPDLIVAPEALSRYQDAVLRRGKHEPVAYLTGSKDFYGRAFHVDRSVLIPRPESELLIDDVKRRFRKSDALTIADIGTGSGCLAVTLALEFPHASVLAVDISDDALRVAEHNAVTHGVRRRITFLVGDLLEPVHRHHLDVIVANLPYVPEHEVVGNPDLAFEPIIALRGKLGPDKTLAAFLQQWYARSQRPLTFIEIHPNQEKTIMRENEKLAVRATVKPDLAGRPRIAVLESKY